MAKSICYLLTTGKTTWKTLRKCIVWKIYLDYFEMSLTSGRIFCHSAVFHNLYLWVVYCVGNGVFLVQIWDIKTLDKSVIIVHNQYSA